MYTITDQLADNVAHVRLASDVVETIRPWFTDNVMEALDELDFAIVRGEPTREIEAYLAITIERAPVR